jgi:hypothetical protein
MVRPTAPAKIMVLRMRSSRSPSARRTNAMRGLDVPHPFAPWPDRIARRSKMN